MIDGYWEKSPTEERTFNAEFSADIPSGDQIKPIGVGSLTGVAVLDSTGFDVTQAMVKSKVVSGTKLALTFQAGTDGMDYSIVARAEMNSADTVFDKIFELRVRARRRSS